MPRGAVILPSYYEAICSLDDMDRLAMYEAMVRYGLYGDLPDLPSHLKALFTLIQPSMAASRNRWEAAKENGEKGGRPKNKPEKNQRETREEPKQNQDIDTDIDTDIDKEKDKETVKEMYKAAKPPTQSRFTPPTVEEVAAYCRERGNNVVAEAFVDHYEASGWMRGKTKIKDWRACVRTWEREQKPVTQKTFNYDYTGDDSL